MASGICYTQSGGVKKYDGIVVPGVAKGDKSYNPGYENIKHDTSSVPGEDHYSFDDPSSYTLVEKGSSTRDDCPLIIVTYYPVAPANPCYFNYKKNNSNIKNITIEVHVKVNGYNNNGHVAFSCSVSGDINGTANNTLANDVLRSNSISLLWKVVTPAGPFGSYTTSITSTGSLTLNTGANYVNGTQYYIDMGNPPSCSPSSGKYNDEYNWDTYVSTAT